MRRRIEITAEDGDTRIRITAIVMTNGTLASSESQEIRDQLADRLMQAVPGLKYTAIPLSRVRVR